MYFPKLTWLSLMISTPVPVLAIFQTAPASQQRSSITGSLLALIYGVGFLYFSCHNTSTNCRRRSQASTPSHCTVKACVRHKPRFSARFLCLLITPTVPQVCLDNQRRHQSTSAARTVLPPHRHICHGLLQLQAVSQDLQELFLTRSYLIPPLHTKKKKKSAPRQ